MSDIVNAWPSLVNQAYLGGPTIVKAETTNCIVDV